MRADWQKSRAINGRAGFFATPRWDPMDVGCGGQQGQKVFANVRRRLGFYPLSTKDTSIETLELYLTWVFFISSTVSHSVHTVVSKKKNKRRIFRWRVWKWRTSVRVQTRARRTNDYTLNQTINDLVVQCV